MEICEHLAAHGWLYAKDDAGVYDRTRALFPPDVVEWVSTTQPQAWDTLVKNHGGKGNPVNPAGGHRTAYLWEEIWARESWLEILGRYLIAKRDKKKEIQEIVFPRFHQLDMTRKLLAAVLASQDAGKYLIQHSAGSGKTKSIAWSAHFLEANAVLSSKALSSAEVRRGIKEMLLNHLGL